MDTTKIISNDRLKLKCREHPNVPCELICLNGDAKQRVMCFNCASKQQIPFSELISINSVLAVNKHEFLQAYPPLKDQELSSRLIMNTRVQQSLHEIEGYFSKLRDDFEKEVSAAQQRAKQSLIKKQRVQQEVLEGYMRIAEVQKLKELIISQKQSAERDLDCFIKDKWNKASENRKVIADLIKQNEAESQFSSDAPKRIALEIIESLKNINFFQQTSYEAQFTLIKSTFLTSQQMEITKVENSIYQVTKGSSTFHLDQVFMDPIIDPLKKYIMHIELEQRQGISQNEFVFGIMKDQGKDNDNGLFQQMSYYDLNNSYGLTKYIKGSPMQSGTKVIGKHSFEVRIHLKQKFLRVACLPDYSSIAELDDPNKIDPQGAYRFFLSMAFQGDMMRITKFRIVDEFDGKM